MAKKILCSVFHRIDWRVMTLIRDKHDTDEAHKVTAVVHPRGKKQERVFVESEVKAAIERRISALPDTLTVEDQQRIRDVFSFLDTK